MAPRNCRVISNSFNSVKAEFTDWVKFHVSLLELQPSVCNDVAITLNLIRCEHCTRKAGYYRMQSVQRRFGKFLPRTADESQVAVLLKDFDDADKMLTRVSCRDL